MNQDYALIEQDEVLGLETSMNSSKIGEASCTCDLKFSVIINTSDQQKRWNGEAGANPPNDD